MHIFEKYIINLVNLAMFLFTIFEGLSFNLMSPELCISQCSDMKKRFFIFYRIISFYGFDSLDSHGSPTG